MSEAAAMIPLSVVAVFAAVLLAAALWYFLSGSGGFDLVRDASQKRERSRFCEASRTD